MEKRKYLYDIIFNSLKQDIFDGSYKPGELLPSERIICQKFSVERTTARKALDLLVSEGLVERKAGVGTKVIYSQNKKTADQKNKNSVIGFFISDENNLKKITEPYYADLFYYLERESTVNNCQLIYSTISNVNDVSEIMVKYDFKAVIFITKTKPVFIEYVRRMNIPIIIINDVYDGVLSVYCDHANGASVALEYLIGMGHKNIGIITGPIDYVATDYKMRVLYKAIAEYKLKIPAENIYYGDWKYQTGYDAAMALVCNREPDKRPTALFSFNDMMAVGAIRALRENMVSVPEDISVVGFDNMEQLKFTEPDLTTIDSNTASLSSIVISSIVNDDVELFNKGVKIVIPVTLIERKTVKKIN